MATPALARPNARSAPNVTRIPLLLFAVAWGTNQFVPLLLVYRARLALTSVELAILFGVYAVGLVPGLVLGGPLSDGRGRRAVVLPASIVAFAGTAILSFGAAGFGVLLAGRFVVGLGAGATFSAGTAWVQDLAAGTPEGTGARRAAIALSSGFGGGPFVAGILAQWLPWPMRLPYAVHAVVLFASIVAVALMPSGARGPRPVRPVPGERVERTTDPHGPVSRTSRRLLPRGFGDVAILAPWVFAFATISFAVLPALLRARLGAFVVVFAGVNAGVTLLTAVVVQPRLRTWPPRSAGLLGLATGAVGLLCAAGASAAMWPPGVLAAAVFLGLGYGGCLISGLRFVEANAPAATRGAVTGIFYVLTYVGFASPLALATLGKIVGDATALLWASALAAATLAYLTVKWKGGQPRRRGERAANETSAQSGA